MHPRRLILSTVVLASVGALSAVTLPALAGTGSAPELAPPSIAGAPAPDLLAALQRDLGLSPDQARDRLESEAWASRTITTLRAELGGDRYAGGWLSQDAGTLTVAVTDAEAAAQVRAAGAEPALVGNSERELDRVVAALDARAPEAAGTVTGWYVDMSTNQVVVLAPASAQARAAEFAAGTGAEPGTVRVRASDEQPQPLADVRGGDPYFIEDVSRCSIGFSVVGQAGEVGGGFVTAGHCAQEGVATTGFDGTAQGQFVAASFPGVGESGPDDWGVVAVNEDWLPRPVVNDFAGGTLPVAGSLEAPVGASVCKYGSTTGVSCGLILAKDTTVVYPQGIVSGLTRTDACAEPGDSGGSWLSGDQAQGVTSGGSGDCTTGGITFFQPLTEILEVNGLTLVTTGEPTPPPAG